MERDEWLARRLAAQYLLNPAPSPQAVCRDLCGLQAQFLRNAVHALRIRAGVARVDGLVKTWTLRGTVHLIPERDLPLYITQRQTEQIDETGWYRWQSERGNANAPQREQELARAMLTAIASGVDTRDVLRLHLRTLGITEQEEARCFDPWGGLIRELAELGQIAFRVEMADALRPNEGKRYRLLPPQSPMCLQGARLELLHRYFAHYGPATLRDAAYFLGWIQAEIRSLLPLLPLQSCAVEGRTAFFLSQSLPSADIPPVLLLAGFDPLMLGYRKEENPFLPDQHLRGIFSLTGIVHPVILLHGQVVGRWKEKDGKAGLTAFEPISQADKNRIEAEMSRLYPIKKMMWTS